MRTLSLLCLAIVIAAACAGEGDGSADLRMRIAPNELLKYQWNVASQSESSGKEQGRNFTLLANTNLAMILSLRGMAAAKGEHLPVTIRIQDMAYTDKRSIGESAKTELTVQKGKIKYVEDGKVVVDSENDIGVDKLADYQRHINSVENAEVRAVLDSTGRQSDVQGEPILVEQIKAGGAQGIFPILAGKTVKPGESWDDRFSMERMADFRLAKPAVVRSRMTFAKWEEKGGKKLAVIDYVSAWENADLKGENSDGLLVEISNVQGRSTGTCLFDPATGRFVSGSIEISMKYRIDGEKDGQTTGLDVSGKTKFSFELMQK